MKYLEIFQSFWDRNEKYNEINNKKRVYNRFIKLYKQVETENDVIDIVEKYICDKKAFIMQKIQLDFYNYLAKEYNMTIPSNLGKEKLKLKPIERQIDILKNSHGIFEISKLADEYGVNYTTIEDDIKCLENGISFMETEIKPQITKDRTKRKYEDTVHPLFLALNLSEVGVLLKFLPELLSKVDVSSEDRKKIRLINGLIERMTLQLSDYALTNLDLKIDETNKILKFVSEKELCELEEGKIAYLTKRSDRDTTIIVNGIDEYKGHIKKKGNDFVIVTTKNEEIKITKDDKIQYKEIY